MLRRTPVLAIVLAGFFAVSPPRAQEPLQQAKALYAAAAYEDALKVLARLQGADTNPVHPLYDRLLLQAARSWEYQPARSGGVAVPSEQVVQIQLKPRP